MIENASSRFLGHPSFFLHLKIPEPLNLLYKPLLHRPNENKMSQEAEQYLLPFPELKPTDFLLLPPLLSGHYGVLSNGYILMPSASVCV